MWDHDRIVKVAAIQMNCTDNINDNLSQAESLVRKAAHQGAQIILLQELFSGLYFCQTQNSSFLNRATTPEENPAIKRLTPLASELKIVLPVSFYEKYNQARYNSVAVIDATGEVLGIYRKSHIPDGPGYSEKFYFSPGDTGFKVWKTKYAKIGIGICWDQWFPEAARIMTLMGAEILFYPTAIGSEPQDPKVDSKDHWQTVMKGHAAANLIPVVVSNRIGREIADNSFLQFYGSSFICDQFGKEVVVANRTEVQILTASFNLTELEKIRIQWGVFRDRRPDLYSKILTLDGSHIHNSKL